jgi:hypothetical protein
LARAASGSAKAGAAIDRVNAKAALVASRVRLVIMFLLLPRSRGFIASSAEPSGSFQIIHADKGALGGI